MVAMRLTAAISREGDWFVAQCLEVDVASQGRTLEEARDNLAEALALYFEDQEVDVGEAPVIMPMRPSLFMSKGSWTQVVVPCCHSPTSEPPGGNTDTPADNPER
jgi:predicted RNase H-like HicB family nuclease